MQAQSYNFWNNKKGQFFSYLVYSASYDPPNLNSGQIFRDHFGNLISNTDFIYENIPFLKLKGVSFVFVYYRSIEVGILVVFDNGSIAATKSEQQGLAESKQPEPSNYKKREMSEHQAKPARIDTGLPRSKAFFFKNSSCSQDFDINSSSIILEKILDSISTTDIELIVSDSTEAIKIFTETVKQCAVQAPVYLETVEMEKEMSSDVKNLLRFFDENKDKIYVPWPDIGKYTINVAGLDTWIRTVSDRSTRFTCAEKQVHYQRLFENSKDPGEQASYRAMADAALQNSNCDRADHTAAYTLFAQLFAQFLRYIPFDEMMDRIRRISHEIVGVAEDHDYIFLFIDDDVSKSNTWIALLYVGELLKLNFFGKFNQKLGIVSNFLDIKKHVESEDDETTRFLVLHFDDMSYSGRQMASSILNKDLQEAYNVSWYLCVAYIGTAAVELFKSTGKPHNIFRNTEIIPSFRTQVKGLVKTGQLSKSAPVRELLSLLSVNDRGDYDFFYGKEAWNCRGNQSAIYFDHKIADSLSVFQKILNGGTFPAEADKCFSIGLINNCPADPYGGKGCMLLGSEKKLETDIPDEVTCPKTFYKNFSYSFNRLQIKKRTDVPDTDRKFPTIVEILTNKNVTIDGGNLLISKQMPLDYSSWPPLRSNSAAQAKLFFDAKYPGSSRELNIWRRCKNDFINENKLDAVCTLLNH